METARIARCGLSVALLAAASSISIPLGPIPFTLQTLVLAMLPIALGGRDAVITVAVYLLLGGIGVPVFSGFSGGIASLVGPTGGFLWGFLLGMIAAAGMLGVEKIPGHLREPLAVLSMLLISYALGTAQLMVVSGMSLTEALLAAVAPFVVADAVKLVVGMQIGRAVLKAASIRRAKS